MKLTPWYPAHIKPVRVGWYHTMFGGSDTEESEFNWWWDGRMWRANKYSEPAVVQNRIWRGIAKGE